MKALKFEDINLNEGISFASTERLVRYLDECLEDVNKKYFVVVNNMTNKNYYSFRDSIKKCLKIINRLNKRDYDELGIKISELAEAISMVGHTDFDDWLEVIDGINELLYEYNLGSLEVKRGGSKWKITNKLKGHVANKKIKPQEEEKEDNEDGGFEWEMDESFKTFENWLWKSKKERESERKRIRKALDDIEKEMERRRKLPPTRFDMEMERLRRENDKNNYIDFEERYSGY